jgi:hypothetical protein
VTKLSLLLKVLEGENEETLGKTYKLFHERALPDLGDNIKCGNSLIGPDFYEGKQLSLIDEEERYRINAFDWNAEFPDIFPSPAGRGKGEGNSGFDAVIGNPPYVRQEALKDSKEYFKKSFSAYNGVADLYVYFIEKGISLLRAGGLFSYIVANKWLRANYGKAMRQWLKKQHIVEIVDFGDQPVFSQATTYPCIIVIQNKQPAATFSSTVIKNLDFSDLSSYVQQHRYEVQQEALDDAGWSLLDQGSQALLSKLRRSGIPLGQYVDREIYYGIKTGLNEAFVIDAATRRKLIQEDPRSEEVIKPFLAGRDIKRYEPLKPQRYLLFTRRGTDIREYPAVKNHLWQFKEKLMPRPKAWQGGKWPGRKPGAYQWYEIQDTIDYYAEFEKPKIIVPAIVRCASYAFDTSGFYSNDKTTIIPTSDKYLLGLISSKLIDFYMHSISSTKRGGYFEYKPMYISKLPIRTIDLSDSSEQEDHNRIVALVETMLRLHKDLQTAKTDHEKSLIQRQIDTTDKEIDNLVYELYDLTDEEIRIVEEVTK